MTVFWSVLTVIGLLGATEASAVNWNEGPYAPIGIGDQVERGTVWQRGIREPEFAPIVLAEARKSAKRGASGAARTAFDGRWSVVISTRSGSCEPQYRFGVRIINGNITYEGGGAAKAATTAIPLVFSVGDDPVRLGVVASLAHPGGNVTGINNFATELVAKRLELLREMVPAATRVAVLVSPSNAVSSDITVRDTAAGARAMGLQAPVLNADTSREIDAAFATLARERPDALFVDPNPFFVFRRVQLVNLASRLAVPTIYYDRVFAEIGGLMSYGASLTDSYRQVGVYTARILKGTKPADLPVLQLSKFELVINHQTARMLGLTVPPTLITTADEVIE